MPIRTLDRMTLLGSDVDELRALARSLRRGHRELARIETRWARGSSSVPWWGPDAARFEHEWTGRHRVQLASVAASLESLADELDRHAGEQTSASAGDGTPSPPTPTGPITPASATTPAVTRISADTARQDPHNSVMAPRSEQRYTGAFDLRVGLALLSTTGELAIADLGQGRRRVTWSEGVGIGATGSLGASAEVAVGGAHGTTGGPNGANASLGGRLGEVRRESWDVGEDDVDDLLARLALDRSVQEATGIERPINKVASWLDFVVGAATGMDPGLDLGAAALTPPRPTRTETLAELDLFASGGIGTAAVAGLGARGTTTSNARVGVGRGDGGTTRILELRGATNLSAAGTLLRRLTGSLPLEFHSAATLRVEQHTSTPDRLTVRASTVDGDTVRDLVAVVHLDRSDAERASAAFQKSIDSALRGDPGAATRLLELTEVRPARIEVASSTGRIDGHSARAGASAAIGVGGGVTVRGSAIQIERRPD